MVRICLIHRPNYEAWFLGTLHAKAAVHPARIKAQRLKEIAMDAAKSIISWDVDGSHLLAKRTQATPSPVSPVCKKKSHGWGRVERKNKYSPDAQS